MKSWGKRIAGALVATAAVGGTLTLTAGGASGQPRTDDRGTRSPITHTIVLYQENISFDHYFGTYGKGSNGIPNPPPSFDHTASDGTVYGPYQPFKLDGQTQATTCDVDHGYTDMINMVHGGAMDRFLQYGNDKTELNPSSSSSTTCPTFESNPAGPALPLGYYEGTAGDPSSPLKDYWSLADNYTLEDNFFQGVYGPSTPGAEWLVAATNNTVHDPNPDGDVCDADGPGSMRQQDIPNLGAAASHAGLSWAWFQGGFGSCTPSATNGYSQHHDPFQYFSSTADLNHQWAMDPNLGYPEANRHQRDLSVLYAALDGSTINGRPVDLPAISWVKAPTADDGHPGYSNPVGDDKFLAGLYARLKSSKYWGSTALIVAFDETGGWWDHVSPPALSGSFSPTVNGSPNLSGCQYPGNGSACGEGGLGPRMPVLVISPYARQGYVDHTQMDTASLVSWVEWNYRLPALGVWGDRDRTDANMTSAFDFTQPGRHDD